MITGTLMLHIGSAPAQAASTEASISPTNVGIASGDEALFTSHEASGGSRLRYYVHVPRQVNPAARVLVLVHGISRNVREHVDAFAGFSRDTGRVVVAPLFSQHGFRRYQRLGRDAFRADRALLDVLEQVQTATGLSTAVVDLFGFSAGAQFGHRFAMLHPGRIGKLALSSAGWFTDPALDDRFPYGTAEIFRPGKRARRNLTSFLAIPMLVMVGEHDVSRDRGLRKEGRLDRTQGFTRLERAGRWVRSLRQAAADSNVQADITFEVLPRCAHSFDQCVERGGLVDRVASWLDR
jgi:pimeloyl-ACP methyl ester carboxylesterase